MASSQLDEESITCGAFHDCSFTRIIIRKATEATRLTTVLLTCLLEQNHQTLKKKRSFGAHQECHDSPCSC